MRPADQLATFVGDAISAGRSRSEIHAALFAAGWSEREADAALAAWADGPFTPPVPRPRPFVSPREAFFHGLMFIALAVSAWHIVALGFSLVDRWVPDPMAPAAGYSASRSIRWSLASLIVFLPLFLVLHLRLNAAPLDAPARRRSLVRKAIGYLTLFLACMALLGDLLAVIYAFLNGELTARFLTKALLVAIVAGVVFAFFRGELADDAEG